MEQLRFFFGSLSRWCVIAFAALLPIFFLPGGFVTIPQGKLALVAIFVAVAALFSFAASIFEGGMRIPRNAVFFAAALLPLAYVTSTIIAGWPLSSVVGGLAEQDTVVAAALLFGVFATAALSVSTHPESAILMLRAFALGVFALVLLHIARLFFPDALSFGGAFPNETVTAAGSWHDLGIVLGTAVVLCGALLNTRVAAGFWRLLFGATAFLSFLFLIVVSMQDVLFVLAGIAAVFGVYAWLAGGEETPSFARGARAGLWIVIAIAAFLLGWFNVWIHDRLPQQLQVVAVEVRPSWEGTLSVGESSLSDSRALLFGTGPNSFARNWALYKPEGVNATLFWNFDFNSGVGVVPTSFVTIGIVGIAVWGLLAIAFLWSAGVAVRATRPFDATQTTIVGITCALLFLFAFHVMYAPGIAVSALLFLLLGVFCAFPLSQNARATFTLPFGLESIGRFLTMVCVGGITIALVLSSAVSIQALTSDALVNRSIQVYNRTSDIPASRALIKQSLRVWPSNDRAHRAAVELGILELGRLLESARGDPAATQELQQTLATTIDHGLAAVSLDRVDYQNWLTLAILYQELAGVGVQGAYEQAQAAFASARSESPTNPIPLFRLAQLEAARGNRGAAISNLDAALAVKPNFAPAHFLRSQLLAQEQKMGDAIASATAVVQIVPQDPLGWYNLGVVFYIAGSYNEAGAAFVQAVTLQPDYSNALFMLALSFYQVGQSDQAIAMLSRVQELNPGDATVPSMIANLQAGKDPFDGLTQQ